MAASGRGFRAALGIFTQNLRHVLNKPSDVAKLREGATYTVSVNVESREYNGRWYTDVRAWRLQPKETAQNAGIPPMPDAAPLEEPSYSTPAAEVDDLPF